MKSPAEAIIERFGGLTKMARAISLPVSTVQGWKERGKIPQDRWDDVMAAGVAAGFTLALDDFVRSVPVEAPAAEQAA